MRTRAFEPKRWWNRLLLTICLCGPVALTGCIHDPQMVPLSRQTVIDRAIVEYPADCTLVQVVKGLNCPTAMCWDSDGNMFIAESGADGSEPHIFGYHKDHSYFNVYPYKRSISFFPTGFVMYGPIGGMACDHHRLFVSHRDRYGKGVITILGYDGTHETLIADLPAQGDYGVTDVVIHNGRVYFGVGTATNSGVVGLDNGAWLRRHPDVCDVMYAPSGSIKTNGSRFVTPNPLAGLGGADLAITPPFQPFGHSNDSRIRSSNKPNGAIFNMSVDGGPASIEAYGIHNPRGLAFDEYDHLYSVLDGMQLRGTRPVADDPDTLMRISQGACFGFPDYSTDGHLITEDRYRPPLSLIYSTGYSDLSRLIDQEASGLRLAEFGVLVYGVFPSLSGAAKMDFIPAEGPFKSFRGDALVALDGDRSPFASSGAKLIERIGFKVALVDMDRKTIRDFVKNTKGVPASQQKFGTVALERPCDVKVGPDGAIYILDFGQMENDSAFPRYHPGTGSLFKLDAIDSSKDDSAK